jgi:hypothetical protein
MQTVEGQRAEGITIAMDDKYFLSCHYTRCVLVFSGADSEWRDTSFTECQIHLMGPALRIINMLHFFGLAGDVGSSSQSNPPSITPSTPIQ